MTHPSDDPYMDFATLLEQSFEELEQVKRGDILDGTILAIDEQGMIIDLGIKRDGVIPRTEIEQLDLTRHCEGDPVTIMVTNMEDRDGNLVVSIQQAIASEDWTAAQRQMERDETYFGEIVSANKGGLIVPYGELRGFIPASHIIDMPRGLDDMQRADYLTRFIGQKLKLKIIEVNSRRRRLVLSQRQAMRDARERAKDDLLETLQEGDVVKGRVRSIRDFGAFIDLGGADGLIHISELAWRRVRNPEEIVSVGDELDVYVLQIDREGKRIGLSLKRLQENPWAEIEESYGKEQLIKGTISRVVSYGAFVELENGIEALLHVSEMGENPPEHPEDLFMPDDQITARIISFEPERQRIGLSIKGVTLAEITPEIEPDTA